MPGQGVGGEAGLICINTQQAERTDCVFTQRALLALTMEETMSDPSSEHSSIGSLFGAIADWGHAIPAGGWR